MRFWPRWFLLTPRRPGRRADRDRLILLVGQFCRMELDIRGATKAMREAVCSEREYGTVCWALQEDDKREKSGWCDGCHAGQGAYRARKILRQKRSGVKRRMVNLYEKLRP